MFRIIARCYTVSQGEYFETSVNILGKRTFLCDCSPIFGLMWYGLGGSRGWFCGDTPRTSVGAHVPPSVRTGCVPLGRFEPVTAVRGAGDSCYVAFCGFAADGQGLVLGWRLGAFIGPLVGIVGLRLAHRWRPALACGAALLLPAANSKSPHALTQREGLYALL